MNGDKTNNITEIFADNLSDISSDDENMDICEDDYDFEDINEVMIPVKKRKRVLEKMNDVSSESANDLSSDSDESADSEIVIRAKKRKVLISSNSESEINGHLINSLSDRVALNFDSNNWSTEDFQPNLEDFEGVWGVTIEPLKPNSIPEVVKLILGDDLFEMFSYQTSVYYSQTSKKQHKINKSLKWSPVSQTEFKKFLALIILMGRTQKGNWKEYWSTESTFSSSSFSSNNESK